MKNQVVNFCTLCIFISLSFSLRAEELKRVELSGGQIIQGPVLKESDDFIFVDLGYDIVKLPRINIIQILENWEDSDQQQINQDSNPLGVSSSIPYLNTPQLNWRQNRDKLLERIKLGVVLVSNSVGTGSGFFIDDQGHIVTNNHVVAGEKKQKVVIQQRDGEQIKSKKIQDVEVIASSSLFDIALLKLSDEQMEELTLNPLPIGKPVSLKEGEQVYAVGNPGMGGQILEQSVTQGIVSAPDRNLNDVLYVQTTAAINPGNSGGPVVNIRGEVVGLVTYKAAVQEGIAFALPTIYIHQFLQNTEAYKFDKNNENSGFEYLKPEY